MDTEGSEAKRLRDSFVRRFCTSAPHPRTLRLVDGQRAPSYAVDQGFLEEVLKDRKNPARAHLIWHNAFVGRKRTKVTIYGTFIAKNSPLFNYPELLDTLIRRSCAVWRRTRNGFTPAVREQLSKKFRPLETAECPFANLPEARSGRWGQGLTKAKMADCRWLKPVLVGQFEFLEWTGDNHLRHTRFICLREDKNARDVRRE